MKLELKSEAERKRTEELRLLFKATCILEKSTLLRREEKDLEF